MSNINENVHKIEPRRLVHEFSDTEYYVGESNNGTDVDSPTWKIKKIFQVGGVWALNLYPEGIQTHTYIWSERLNYTYQ